MRRKNITIDWQYPLSIASAYNLPVITNNGIYCIYRKFGNKNSLIYIGKASSNFSSRVDCPQKECIYSLRGEKTVRFGIMVSPNSVKSDPALYDNLLEDIESALIWEIKPLMNRAKIHDYTYRSGYYVQIHNRGYLGELLEFIDASKHEYYESGIL